MEKDINGHKLFDTLLKSVTKINFASRIFNYTEYINFFWRFLINVLTT